MLAEQFDSLFFRHQQRINRAFASQPSPDLLGTVYIQFQFDGDWKGATAGVRVGRYSAKHNDIQAYIAVSADRFSRSSHKARERLISEGVLAVLQVVQKRLDAKLTKGMPPIIAAFEKESQLG